MAQSLAAKPVTTGYGLVENVSRLIRHFTNFRERPL